MKRLLFFALLGILALPAVGWADSGRYAMVYPQWHNASWTQDSSFVYIPSSLVTRPRINAAGQTSDTTEVIDLSNALWNCSEQRVNNADSLYYLSVTLLTELTDGSGLNLGVANSDSTQIGIQISGDGKTWTAGPSISVIYSARQDLSTIPSKTIVFRVRGGVVPGARETTDWNILTGGTMVRFVMLSDGADTATRRRLRVMYPTCGDE